MGFCGFCCVVVGVGFGVAGLIGVVGICGGGGAWVNAAGMVVGGVSFLGWGGLVSVNAFCKSFHLTVSFL